MSLARAGRRPAALWDIINVTPALQTIFTPKIPSKRTVFGLNAASTHVSTQPTSPLFNGSIDHASAVTRRRPDQSISKNGRNSLLTGGSTSFRPGRSRPREKPDSTLAVRKPITPLEQEWSSKHWVQSNTSHDDSKTTRSPSLDGGTESNHQGHEEMTVPSDERRKQDSAELSFVHRQLLLSSPPPPSEILDHIRRRPELLTGPAAKTLIRYARRVRDGRTEYEVTAAMSQFVKDQNASASLAAMRTSSIDRLGHRMIPSRHRSPSRKFLDGAAIPTTHEKLYESLDPNAWAAARWPPSPLETADGDVEDYLCGLHHTLLTLPLRSVTVASPKDIPIPTMSNGTESDPQSSNCPSLRVALDEVALRSRHDQRTPQGVIHAKLDVLTLFIVYANRLSEFSSTPTRRRPGLLKSMASPRHGLVVLLEFLQLHPQLRLSRQVLHLLIQEALWESPRSATTVLEGTQSSEELVGMDTSPSSVSLQQSKRPSPVETGVVLQRALDDIRILIEFFNQRWKITPGPETFRHIALYALSSDSPGLARFAWDGWWSEMDRKTGRQPRGGGHGPRWDHRELHWRRWSRLIPALRNKGWIMSETEWKDSGLGGSRINHVHSTL